MTTPYKPTTKAAIALGLAGITAWGAYSLGRRVMPVTTAPQASQQGGGSVQKHVRLTYGDRLSNAALQAVHARFGSSWRHALVVILNDRVEDFHAHISYLRVLRERYREDGLVAGCIAPANLATASEGQCHSVFKSDNVDWAELLEARESVLVVSDEGRVEFGVLGVPPPDTLRQLAEKYSTGHVDYHLVGIGGLPRFVADGAVPDIAVTPLGKTTTVPLTDVARDGTTIVYFGSSCSTCNLGVYAPSLSTVARGRRAGDIVVLFAASADDPRVTTTLRGAGLEGRPVYEVHSVSTAYATRFAKTELDGKPIVVSIGPGGRVLSVAELGIGGL